MASEQNVMQLKENSAMNTECKQTTPTRIHNYTQLLKKYALISEVGALDYSFPEITNLNPNLNHNPIRE